MSQVRDHERALPPPHLRVAFSPGVRAFENGRLLVGGFPLRAVRVTDAGGRVTVRWKDGGPIGESLAERSLAQRLLGYDMLCPLPEGVSSLRALTVVVPVRDRVKQLARCLQSLRATCGEAKIIVVDDCSADPGAVRGLCDKLGIQVIRRPAPGGAGAARNTGLRACETLFVAFVDSDVVVPSGWAHSLLAQFADQSVAAVAPRVRALPPSTGTIGGYEKRHSALDMGARAGCVGPGRPIAYVPAATLVVRRSSVNGGFDPSLAIGEDVDFVWRMVAAGWRIRYAPDVHVWHDHRDQFRSFVARRRAYARSVAPLARRHPQALPAVRLKPHMAVPWCLAVLGRRWMVLAAVLVDVAIAGKRLSAVSDRPYGVAGTLVVRGLLTSGQGLAHAARRAWAPPLLVAGLWRRRAWALLAAAFAVPIIRDACAAGELRVVPAEATLRLLDEIVALWGRWEGCVRDLAIEPLLLRWDDPPSR